MKEEEWHNGDLYKVFICKWSWRSSLCLKWSLICLSCNTKLIPSWGKGNRNLSPQSLVVGFPWMGKTSQIQQLLFCQGQVFFFFNFQTDFIVMYIISGKNIFVQPVHMRVSFKTANIFLLFSSLLCSKKRILCLYHKTSID